LSGSISISRNYIFSFAHIRDTARCDFEDIPPGTYALAAIHDENVDGKLDTNFDWDIKGRLQTVRV